jgi:hypothetical protein
MERPDRMDEVLRWQEKSGRHLSAELARLRRLLEQASRPDDHAFDGTKEAADDDTPIETAAGDPPPPLAILAQRFGLNPFERDVLLLAAAPAFDSRFPHLCSRVLDQPEHGFPSFAVALAAFAGGTWEALAPWAPLRRHQLIEVVGEDGQAPSRCPIRADERVVNYVKGLNHLDARLAALLSPVEADDCSAAMPESWRVLSEQVINILRRPRRELPPLVQLTGGDRLGRQEIARRSAAALELDLVRLDGPLLPANLVEAESLLRLWNRETRLLPVALYVEIAEAAIPHEQHVLAWFLQRCEGAVFVGSESARALEAGTLVRPIVSVQVPSPERDDRRRAWEAELGPDAGAIAVRLADQFELDRRTIGRIARSHPRLDQPEAAWSARLWDICRAATRPDLEGLAQRLESCAGWNDLVLPAAELRMLRLIADQVRHRETVHETWGFRRKESRGLGITALFVGESGTGKTLASEVLANELALDLYRIDLAAVVSKYIGETEKNLGLLFKAAEAGGAVLFFDEADALFGKRSEVKDSHDRYANIEVDYLLQRMETYRGLAVLATNDKAALDRAFLRRLRFVVTFPFPGLEQREAIWRGAFPAATPVEGLDYAFLARWNLAGGSIHNIALGAAFLAASAGTAVTMPLVIEAARHEFRKLEKTVSESDFHWQRPARTLPS